MAIQNHIKLELTFKFYLKSSIRIHLSNMSSIINNTDTPMKLYTNSDGFIIESGYTFSYNKHGLTLPTHLNFDDYSDSELYSYYNYLSNKDRYQSLKRLYKYLKGFSQSLIFQYDNTGYVDMVNNTWKVY